MDSDLKEIAIEYLKFQKEVFGNDVFIDIEELNRVRDRNKQFNENKIKIVESRSITSMKKKENEDIPKSSEHSPNPNVAVKEEIYANSLLEFKDQISKCLKCELGKTRTNFVFGVGSPTAKLMIIGEAPGADEDAQGEPFVGRAGQLLTKILEAIGFSREEVYICNIIKCRPPNNRRPTQEEVDCCIGYLKHQIKIIKPALILAVGLTAVDSLLKKTHKMGEIRGKWLEFESTPMLATYHPAALLRNPNWKTFTWQDVQKLRLRYDEIVGDKPPFNPKS